MLLLFLVTEHDLILVFNLASESTSIGYIKRFVLPMKISLILVSIVELAQCMLRQKSSIVFVTLYQWCHLIAFIILLLSGADLELI